MTHLLKTHGISVECYVQSMSNQWRSMKRINDKQDLWTNLWTNQWELINNQCQTNDTSMINTWTINDKQCKINVRSMQTKRTNQINKNYIYVYIYIYTWNARERHGKYMETMENDARSMTNQWHSNDRHMNNQCQTI